MGASLALLLAALSFWLGRRIQRYLDRNSSAEAAAGELAEDAIREIRRLSSRICPMLRLVVRKIASWFGRFRYPG